eukprot:581286-Hanusia_phi.AAC.1
MSDSNCLSNERSAALQYHPNPGPLPSRRAAAAAQQKTAALAASDDPAAGTHHARTVPSDHCCSNFNPGPQHPTPRSKRMGSIPNRTRIE